VISAVPGELAPGLPVGGPRGDRQQQPLGRAFYGAELVAVLQASGFDWV